MIIYTHVIYIYIYIYIYTYVTTQELGFVRGGL